MYFNKEQIINSIDMCQVIPLIEEGFIRLSRGDAVIPPFGSMHFEKPKGEVHIKYGYIKDHECYVVKIASNFYDNHSLGIPAGQGLLLVFSRLTGQLKAILNDEGYLTEIRTAAAGAIAAKYLAPNKIKNIGVIGTGSQAYYQLLLLKQVLDYKRVYVWSRNQDHLQKFIRKPEFSDFDMIPALSIAQLTQECNLIITATSSSSPLITAENVLPGTHITAVGADDYGKHEIDTKLFNMADIVAVDSREQCFLVGDSSYAIKNNDLDIAKVYELGEILVNPLLRRKSDEQITIADLTGVAVQDIQIATAVYKQLVSTFP